jgi:hypothetical protein
LRDILLEYRALFPTTRIGMRGIKGFKYKLQVVASVAPIRKKQRPLTSLEKSTIIEHVESMLKHGIISPSVSPWAFQVVLVPKIDGTLRFCINFKPLNDVTVKDKYPLPRIEDCVHSFAGRQYFSTLDCFAGYWQIELEIYDRDSCSSGEDFC